MEVISSFRKDFEWVRRDAYFYRASRRRGGTTSYTCTAAACRAKFNVRDGVLGQVCGQHDHDEEPWIPNRNLMYQNIKRRCREEATQLMTIHLEEAARYPDAAPHLLYNIVPSMRKWRRVNQPPVPRTMAGYGTALENHGQFSRLYIGTVEAAGGGQAVILGPPGYQEILAAADTILADGTFKTVPAGLPASQILTLHCSINGHYYHPLVALMEHRQRPLYAALFQRVWELAGNPRPEHIVTDYEPALQGALGQVSGIPTVGCYFHYTQALIRKAKGLHISVRPNSPGLRLVRLYCALALLPPERIPAALQELPRAARGERLPFNADFHSYFMDFWMVQVTPDCFSVHGRPHRTTNIAESYHRILATCMGGPAPNVWSFTHKMAEMFANCTARRQAQLAGAAQPTRRNRARQLIRAAAVNNNLRALDAGVVTLRHFLVAASTRIHVGEAVADHDVPEMAEEVEVADWAEEVSDAEEEVPLPPAPLAPAPLAPAPLAPAPAPPAGPRCGVCQEEPPTRVLIPCGHVLCDECLVGVQASGPLLRDRCPYCRTHIGSCINIYL